MPSSSLKASVRKSVIGLLLSSILLSPSCAAPFQDDVLPGEAPDTTKLEGLSFSGELTEYDKKDVVVNVTIGDLDIKVLHSTLISTCAEELWGENGNLGVITSSNIEFCTNNVLLNTENIDYTDSNCKAFFCRAELGRCLAFKYIELAEAVSETNFEGRPFESVAEVDEGEFSDVSFEITGLTPSNKLGYRIPPLPAASKSLAYLLALESLRFSASASLFVFVANSDTTDSCINLIPEGGPTDDFSMRDLLTYGFGESVFQYGEVTKKLIENQLNVSVSNLAETPDYSSAQNAMWMEGFNSHYGAIRVLLNRHMDDTIESSASSDEHLEQPLPGCPVAMSSRSEKHALKLLRATALKSVYDTSVPTTDIIAEVAQKRNFCATFSDCLSAVDAYLDDEHVTQADFSLARQYLIDESKAFHRVHTDSTNKYYGMHKPTFQNPPSFYTAWSNTDIDADQYSSFIYGYPKQSAVRAVDQFRDYAIAAMLTRKDVLSDEQYKHLANTAMVAESLVGKKRISTQPIAGTPGEFVVTIHGATEEEKESLHLLSDVAAYRCAVEGTIDGAPCDLDFVRQNIVLESSKAFFGGGDIRYPLDTSVRITYEVNHPLDRSGKVFYLISLNAPGFSELLAAFVPDLERPQKYPVIQGSIFNELGKDIVVRSESCCGLPEQPCGDIPYSRDFVPALENELIVEGDDHYESSWRFYLNRAKASAEKADRLGDDLVAAGLRIDQTSEEAQTLLETECGGVLNLDPFDVIDGQSVCEVIDGDCDIVSEAIKSNPSLENCLPLEWGGSSERIEYSTLGYDKLCSFVNSSGVTCECEDTDELCKSFTCPQVVTVAEGEEEDCTGKFQGLDPKYKLLPLMNPLGVFKTPYEEVGSSVGTEICSEGTELWLFLIEASLLNGSESSITTVENEVLKNPMLGADAMKAVLNRIEFNERLLWHYDFRFDGNLIWTTFREDQGDCPNDPPWDENATRPTCVSDGSLFPPLGYGTDSTVEPELKYDWLFSEISTEEDNLQSSNGYGIIRKQWGEKMLKLLFAMGLLAGEVRGIRIGQTEVGYSNEPCDQPQQWESYGSDDDDFIWPFLPTHHTVDTSGGSLNEIYCLNSNPSLNCGFPYSVNDSDPNRLFVTNPGVAFCYNIRTGSHPTAHCNGRRKHMSYMYREDQYLALSRVQTDDGWRQFSQNFPAFIAGRDYSSSITDNTFVFNRGDEGWLHVTHDAVNQRLYLESHGDSLRNWPFSEPVIEITRSDFFNALRLACYLKKNGSAIADANLRNIGEMPGFSAPNSGNLTKDIDAIRDYMASVHRKMMRAFASAIISQLPKAFKDGYVTGDMTNLYETYKGKNLDAMLQIADGLDTLSSAALGLDMAFVKIINILDIMEIDDGIEDENEAIIDLERSRSIASNLANAMSSIASALSSLGSANYASPQAVWSLMAAAASAVAASCHFAIMDIDIDISSHKSVVNALSGQKSYRSSLIQLADQFQALWSSASLVEKGYRSIQAGVNALDSVQNKATYYLGKYLLMDTDGAGRAMHSNTVTRRIYNTLKYRYQRALKAAKTDAFLAKRAIEFRIGSDLNEFQDPLGSVDPPSQWADSICKMQGFDYRKLREANVDDPLYSELAESQHYGSWYIGDYVQNLDDFIVGYVNKHPFSDEDDVAVISLKNDVMKARASCEVESRNLLTYSSMIGYLEQTTSETCVGEECTMEVVSTVGWMRGGCGEGLAVSMEHCEFGTTTQCTIADDCIRAEPKSARISDTRQSLGSNYVHDSFMEASGVSSWTAVNASLSKVEPVFPYQSRSLMVTRTATSGGAYASQNHGSTNGILASSGRLRLIGWAKGDGSVAPRVSFGSAIVWTGTISTDWQQIKVKANHDAANGTDLRLEVLDGNSGNYVEFENVGLHRVIPTYPVVPLVDDNFGYTSAKTYASSNSGYIYQRISNLRPGHYVLSWTDQHPDGNTGSPVEYLASAYDVAEEEEYSWPFTAHYDPTAADISERRKETRQVEAFDKYDWGDVEIRFRPSSNDTARGDVRILRAQFERVGDWDLYTGTDPVATTYVENGQRAVILSNDCEDTTGQAMRGEFTRDCTCPTRANSICLPSDRGTDNEQCFWEYPIVIGVDKLERLGVIASGSFALGNYNYRQGKMAVNVVGTNVIDCQSSPIPSTCYANAFLQYTIRHGGETYVKNHRNDVVEFKIPAARIEHAKALVAEVLVTNPLGNTASQLLIDYWKTGLQGRPLQGIYALRIWDTPGLRWDKIEDIQIIFKYRYWTAME